MRCHLSLPITSVLVLLFLSSSTAQWSSDPYENTIVATNAFEPKMVSDGAGGAIIVWWNGDDYGLHAQRLDKYGYARWGNNGVYLGGIGWYQTEYFSLCEDGNGGCVVAFDDIYTEYPTYYARIYAQRIDSLGNKLWGNVGTPVCDIDSIGVGAAHVVPDGLGGFFVIWTDRRGPLRVYGQHLDGNGNGTWIENGICISGTSNFSNEYSALVPGGPGYCLAFWDHLIQAGDRRPRVQRIDFGGNLLWGEGIIFPETMSYFGSRNRYTGDNQGGAIATGYVESGYHISDGYTQRIDSNGTFLWGDNGVQFSDSITLTAAPLPAEIASNDLGAFYIWRNGESGAYRIYIQHISQLGNTQWQQNGLLISDPLISCGKSVLTTASISDIICVWYELENTRLIAQKYNNQGNRLWILADVPISYNTYGYDDLRIIGDMAQGAIICWYIYPAILYVQQISANGNLGEVLAVEKEHPGYIPAKISLLQNYPNPFNEATVIPIFVPPGISRFPIDIKIFNILGQTIYSFDSQRFMPGVNCLSWNGTNNSHAAVSSGLYIVMVKSQEFSGSIRLVKLK